MKLISTTTNNDNKAALLTQNCRKMGGTKGSEAVSAIDVRGVPFAGAS